MESMVNRKPSLVEPFYQSPNILSPSLPQVSSFKNWKIDAIMTNNAINDELNTETAPRVNKRQKFKWNV